MPNYCNCTLRIDGSRDDLANLRARLRLDDEGHYRLFESLLPMPDALRDTDSPSPLETGTVFDEGTGRQRPITTAEREHLQDLNAKRISWQREHWGVTAGDWQTVAEWDDDIAEFEFLTRWLPPTAGMSAIAAMFPSLDLRLRYDEPDCELRGTVVWSGGRRVRESRELVYERPA